MTKPLSVLIVGETEIDTRLILRILRKGGYKPTFEVVKTAAQMRKSVKKQDWEVVISSCNLPKFDGPAALKILQESRMNIPFIVVSDSLGKEASVELLKAGACDCISRDNLERLVPVVERELAHSAERRERKQVEAALRESEDKFKYAFDHSVTGKSVTLPTGELNVNQAFCKMLGYTQKELKNRRWQEITHPGDVELTQHAIDKLVTGEHKSVRFIKRYIHKNGSTVWADVGIALRVDKDGQPLYFISSINDITERNHAVEALRDLSSRQEAILAAVPDILMEVNQDKVYTWANSSGIEFFGKDVIGNKADFYFEGEQATYDVVSPLFQGDNDVIYVESWQRRKDDEKRLLAWWCRNLKDKDGKVTGALSSAHDITASRAAEESLRVSEERFRAWIENASDLVTVIGADGKIQYESPSVERLLGYKPKELIGRNVFELVHPDDRERAMEIFNQNIQKPESLTSIEVHFSHHDGSWRMLEVLGKPYLDEHGQMAALINSRDITERKAAEEAVRQSEEKFRLSFMTSMDAFYWSALEDGKIIDVNPVFEEVWGYSREEVVGKTSVELGLYQDPADRSRMVSELKEKGHVKDLELKGKRKDGRLITVSLSGNIMQINDQASILGVIRDITEKKLAGQQREILYQVLRAVSGQLETEVVARAAVETFVKLTGYPHVFIALPDENMTHWAVRAAAGSLAAELGATYPIHKGVIGNAFKTGQTQWVRDVLEDPHYVNDVKKPGGPALRSEFVALMRSGDNLLGALNVESDHADAFDDSDIWMIQSVADIISLALQNAKMFGEAEQEIRERKRAEQALQESEKRFRVIFEKANDGIIITRENNEIVDVNARMCALLGYSREEFLKLKIPDLQAPEVRQAGDVVKRELERHGDKLFEGVDIDRSGRRIPIEISVGRVELPSGEFFVSVIRDISERKQTQTLQEAVYRIAAAADTTRSLDDFYPQIHEIISSVMPARNFYITLYDEAQNMLRFPYFKDAEDEPIMGGIQPGQGLSAYVLRTGKSLLCTKAVHDELERQGEVKLLGVASAIWLGVPLIVEGKPIGAMVLQHYTDPNAYGPREQHMLEYVSTQVAIAINRLRAEEGIRSLNTELEQRVVERTRDLRDAQDKIVRQEKLALLGQLAGGVGHELRNPLGIISNAIYYLKHIQPDAEEKVRQYHAMIEQEVRTSEKIINDLLDFARLDSVDREPVKVRELVQRTLTRFTVPESIKTTIRISEDLPKVLVDLTQMEQVLGNLTVNACQAMVTPRGTTPLDSPAGFTRGGELTIAASGQEEMIAISVKDTGVGIPPENIGKIFEPLFTTKPKGIGLGLAVSRKLAEANGGRIEVKSEPGKGSTFTLFLPVEIKS